MLLSAALLEVGVVVLEVEMLLADEVEEESGKEALLTGWVSLLTGGAAVPEEASLDEELLDEVFALCAVEFAFGVVCEVF